MADPREPDTASDDESEDEASPGAAAADEEDPLESAPEPNEPG